MNISVLHRIASIAAGIRKQSLTLPESFWEILGEVVCSIVYEDWHEEDIQYNMNAYNCSYLRACFTMVYCSGLVSGVSKGCDCEEDYPNEGDFMREYGECQLRSYRAKAVIDFIEDHEDELLTTKVNWA